MCSQLELKHWQHQRLVLGLEGAVSRKLSLLFLVHLDVHKLTLIASLLQVYFGTATVTTLVATRQTHVR